MVTRRVRSRTDDKMMDKFQFSCLIGFDKIERKYLEEQRKYWISHRDLMISFQKKAFNDWPEDKEHGKKLAKFFKEEAAEAMKHYRSACLLLGQYGSVLGDCTYRDTYEWSEELLPYLNRLELQAAYA